LVLLFLSIIDFKLRYRSDIENDIEIIALRHKAQGKREKILPLHPQRLCGEPLPLAFERKKLKKSLTPALSMALAAIVMTALLLPFPLPARADLSLIKEIIIEYNLDLLQKSLVDGSYKGEEGILRIRPEIGRSFGLKVLIDQEYLEARDLLKKADGLLERAEEVLITQEEEKSPGEHVKKLGELGLGYNTALQSAKERMMAYRSKLTSEIDDRLNPDICSKLLKGLLLESLKQASCNLRDALGLFYNKCQDLDENNGPLNVENIKFVNHVVYEFKEKTTQKTINRFDLDRQNNNSSANPDTRWKHSLGRAESRYIPLVEPLIEKHKKTGYSVDLLLFLALMKQESRFNPRAVSQVGAVGLTQIMPRTARGLGMKIVFEPLYFSEAGTFMGREQNLKNRAKKLILEITDENNLEPARRARELMEEALKYKERRTILYARYKKEVLENETDDRLDSRKAIKYGFKYFVSVMKQQEGDISLALASYNAGPHRVKQYKGIPPYAETIQFRNRVLRYYRNYLRELNINQGARQECIEQEGIPDERTAQEITGVEQKIP
jgi:hypothetical protein